MLCQLTLFSMDKVAMISALSQGKAFYEWTIVLYCSLEHYIYHSIVHPYIYHADHSITAFKEKSLSPYYYYY